jgi:non-homologous end joining protein Ku
MDLLHDPALLQGAGESGATPVTVTDEEVALAGLLIDSATGPIRWSDCHDDTAERLAALVEAKLRGQSLPAAPPEEVPVLPLLDALEQSLGAAPGPPSRARQTPRKKTDVPRGPTRATTRGTSPA